jgi:hypothetical protein
MDYRVHFTNEVGGESSSSGYGHVELLEQINVSDVLEGKEPPATSSAEFSGSAQCTALCLLSIPSHMIPTEILRFFESHLPLVQSISIYRHAAYEDKYFGVLQLTSIAATSSIIEEYDGQVLSSVDKVRCILRPVARVVFASSNELVLSSPPGSSLVDTEVTDGAGEAGSCPVCLEPISLECPMTITTCCNHTYGPELPPMPPLSLR